MKKLIAGLALMCGLFLLPCTVNAAVPYAGVFKALNEEYKEAEYEVQINEMMNNLDEMITNVDLLKERVKRINEKLDAYENYISGLTPDGLSYTEDVKLIALVTNAEAEGESEYGMRLVIDTILNRVDSKDFPNTVSDVVYQRGQYDSMWNGRANKVKVEDYICDLVVQEMQNRTDPNVRFFRTKHYGYGTPYTKVGHHYFST